jgi:hypothetical protein
MLTTYPTKGDLVKLPQATVVLKKPSETEAGLVYAEIIDKPVFAIYLEQYTDNVSRLVVEDKIRYVHTEHLHDVGA